MPLDRSVSDIRHDYSIFKLDKASIKNDPIKQFELWFNDAKKADFVDPNAMVLSTVNTDSQPSSRVVLLKQFDSQGFVFFTNYNSEKGKDLENNNKASLLFFWDKFERQVRINGTVTKITKEESDEYFQSRPYKSKIGAWASKQSQELSSRFSLMRKFVLFLLKYPKNVPLPEFWGGYRLNPNRIEFWQGRDSRLHDRFQFNLINGIWEIKRLNP